MNETTKKIMALQARRWPLLEKLVPVSHAAANQMKDAGMKAGAEPLSQVLFELDANNQELAELVKEAANGADGFETLMDLMKLMDGPK